MKEWQKNLVGGITGLVIGIVMVLTVFLQILMGYVLSLTSAWYLLFFGMFFTGMGVGTLASTYTIYNLERD